MQDLIHNLGIDWRLLLFQVINFSVLFVVLHRFVFKPLLDILARRKKKIEEGLSFSLTMEHEKKEWEERKAGILTDARKNASEKIAEAQRKALALEKEILDDARAKAELLASARAAQAEEERRKIVDRSGRDILDVAFAMAKKALVHKMTPQEDKKFTESFVKRS